MDNLFLKYMNKREGKNEKPSTPIGNPGPVITISREYGCHGKRIAQKLAGILTAKSAASGENKEWRWISKEILEESAKELKLSSSLVKELSDYKHSHFFKDLALFFSEDYYPGDATIKNTIAKYIHDEAEQGYVIIVGRAGEAITKSINRSFHVKLEAPLEWRSQVVSEEEGLSPADAKKECQIQDKRRAMFRDYFEKGKKDIDFFDAILNCKALSDEEILELLIIISETRGFI
ncbi:cytidylate kinase-like family protein [Carboxylicivirga marina]|uniref:Cytidylate kinase-like family protein n=1 Tax=Carboxylicivirga marina TaxID=2800988 RepID=A0ABS1HN44_9BACT|nr:cytidylate kinase-like family protein [Carboxylicivirga marina]MBK3518962.1 cytidylate kinase-like family protein [Carboxylicivirga marina]